MGAKAVIASLIMSAAVILINRALSDMLDDGVLERIIKLFLPSGIGVIIYACLLYMFRVNEIRSIVGSIIIKFRYKNTKQVK